MKIFGFLAGPLLGSSSFELNFTFKFVLLTYTADNFRPEKFQTIISKPSCLHSIFPYAWQAGLLVLTSGDGSCLWRHTSVVARILCEI